jgi:hypothetical protein
LLILKWVKSDDVIYIKKKCIEKWKSFGLLWIFYIWIVIKNYWCDIKSEKSENVLMLIGIKKYEKGEKRNTWTVTHYSVMYCPLANKAFISVAWGSGLGKS